MKTSVKYIIYTLLVCNTTTLLAQTDPEAIALVTDDFQEAYYQSLLEKAIENYDKAIISLQKCLLIQPKNAAVHHELGKNYFSQKDYLNAEQSFITATTIETQNKWYWIDLYEVYYQAKNYNQAITVVQKIIPLDKNYKDDLVSLYMYTKQYDKALVLINELDQTQNKSQLRDKYRLEINAHANNHANNKTDLEKAIEDNPQIEENYLSLIEKYSISNQEEKARLVAEKLQKAIPDSQWAYVFLFKYYLNDNLATQAIKALEVVLEGKKIDKKIKFKMYNEFLIFVTKNPIFEKELQKATTYFENDSQINVYKEVGKFYYKKKAIPQAIQNLEKAFAINNNDLENNIFLLVSYQEINNYLEMQKKATQLIDTYPNQPEYYFFAAKSYELQKDYTKAINYYELGLEYIVDKPNLELDFYIQLAENYKQLGNQAKSNAYITKANNLKNKK